MVVRRYGTGCLARSGIVSLTDRFLCLLACLLRHRHIDERHIDQLSISTTILVPDSSASFVTDRKMKASKQVTDIELLSDIMNVQHRTFTW